MATTFWIGNGGVEGKLTDNANWTANAPGAGDIGVLNAGSVDVNPGLGQIAQVTALLVYAGYTGDVGGAGNEMVMGAGLLKFLSGGNFWWKDGGTTTDVYIRATAAPTPEGPVVNLGGDTAANVHCIRGDITIAGTIGNMVQLTVGFKDNPTTDVKLLVVANANAITDYFQFGGVVDASMNIARAQVCGGILNYNSSAVISSNLVVGGGTVNHNASGPIANLQMYGGHTDLGDTAKTITKSAIFPGATFVHNDDIHVFTAPLEDLRENVSGN